MNAHNRIAILGVAIAVLAGGCSSAPLTLYSPATVAPPATPTSTVAPSATPSTGRATHLYEGELINFSLPLASEWTMKAYDTWRIDVSTFVIVNRSLAEIESNPRYIGLATESGEKFFGIGVDMGQFAILLPGFDGRSVDSKGILSEVRYELNMPYDLTMTVCEGGNGAYGVSWDIKRGGENGNEAYGGLWGIKGGESIARGSIGANGSKTPSEAWSEPLTRVVTKSGTTRDPIVDTQGGGGVYRVSSGAASCDFPSFQPA